MASNLISSLKTTLYRQECFLAWNLWNTGHGRNWEQNFCIRTVMTPSTKGRLSGLSGDFEFGFSALDLKAPDKMYKKKVLETWEGSWGCAGEPPLSIPARTEFRQAAELLFIWLCWLRAAYGTGQDTASVSRGRCDSACGNKLVWFFWGRGEIYPGFWKVDRTLESDTPGFPQKRPPSWSLFSVSMLPRHLKPWGLCFRNSGHS